MDPYANRTYRNFAVGGTTAYRVTQGESDLFIRTVGEHRQVAERALAEVRRILTDHLAAQPAFATSLTPLDVPASAPPLIGSMAQASREAGVGPMAAVAGAVAQAVGEALTDHSPQVLVENGGDVYLKLTDDFHHRPGRRRLALFRTGRPGRFGRPNALGHLHQRRHLRP